MYGAPSLFLRQSEDLPVASQPDSKSRTEQLASRFVAYMMLVMSYLFGAVSLLVWMAFLFHGSLNVVNLHLGEAGRLGLNACLCLAFFIQHSIMVRRSFRQWLARFIREDFHSAFYTIVSGLFLLTVVLFWQESAHTLAAPQGIVRWLMHVVFFLSIVGFHWGTRALGSFDMFGVDPILHYLRGTNPPPPMPFTVRGPYRWVRHPLYFFCLLMIWSCPNLSADRLLYNVLWTAWIIVATVLEERDLAASFGQEYRNYQSKVPMLIPHGIRPAQ
jgi:protein-S-isoprenylcysteine O-methyltransferase Ste14